MANNIDQKAQQILERIKNDNNKKIEEAIVEAVEVDSNKSKESKQEEIEQLRKRVKELMKENEKKEAKIEEIINIDELEDLKDVNELEFNRDEIASQEEREKVADRFTFLARAITNNKFLRRETLKTFDLYRERMINRSIEEEDLGKRVDNLS